MKHLIISRLAPGIDNARKALEVFQKAGLPPGTEATWAAADGKTFVSIVETDALDMTTSATYAPFFEESTTIPVVPLDDAWMKAIQAAQDNWG
jgi:hypothetical protein